MRLGVFMAVGIWAVACGSTPQPNGGPRHVAGLWSNSPPVCGVDYVREYQCEELLSTSPAMPAPAPYESCPMNLEGARGEIAPAPPVAIFDSDYTEHIRKRMPPGHSCCYSWCSRVRVVPREEVPANAGCDGGHQLREEVCFDELEAGSSDPAPEPFARCPAAVVPPEGMSFSAPRAAPFDPQGTAAKRAQGFKQCCYGWCSKAPPEAIKEKKK